MKTRRASMLVLIAVVTMSAPLLGHHGNAAFDTASVTVKGTVTDWTWGNPHCFVKFDATDDKGNVVHWVSETSNPSDMIDRGWAKTSLKPGDQVTVTMVVVKSGKPIGRVQKIVFADGHVLNTVLPTAPPS